MHNLYGAYEVKATAEALRAIRNKRQFIFTRCGQRLAQRLLLARGSVHMSVSPITASTLSACHCQTAMSAKWGDSVSCRSVATSAYHQHPPQASGPALHPPQS